MDDHRPGTATPYGWTLSSTSAARTSFPRPAVGPHRVTRRRPDDLYVNTATSGDIPETRDPTTQTNHAIRRHSRYNANTPGNIPETGGPPPRLSRDGWATSMSTPAAWDVFPGLADPPRGPAVQAGDIRSNVGSEDFIPAAGGRPPPSNSAWDPTTLISTSPPRETFPGAATPPLRPGRHGRKAPRRLPGELSRRAELLAGPTDDRPSRSLTSGHPRRTQASLAALAQEPRRRPEMAIG
jgi:hypothetical protein